MKNSLFRVIIKRYAGLLVSMLLVLSLGCGLMSGMSNGFLSLKETLDEYISDMKYPDVVITTMEYTTKDRADLIRSLEGVEEVNPRLKGNLVLIGSEGRYMSAEALTYEEQDFSQFYYWEKTEKQGEYPILLEHAFCENNDIHAGDELNIRLGEEERACTVYGVVSRPETLSTPSIGSMKVSAMDICYMYVPVSVLINEVDPKYVKAYAEWEEKTSEYEEAKEKADSEHEKALEKIADSEKELSEKEKELKDKKTEAEERKDSLISNREELKQKQQELDEFEYQIYIKKQELADGEKALEQARLTIEDENLLQEEEEKLRLYQSQIQDSEEKLAYGRWEIENYLFEIEQTIGEIEQGIRDWEAEFEKARDLLKEKKEELSSEWEKTVKELSQAEEELQRAKTKLDEWPGYDAYCNQFLIRVSKGTDPENVRCRAEEVLNDIEIKESYTYLTSPVKNKIEDKNLNPLEIMTMYVPMVYFGVALIVIFLFMTLLVRWCRREIGILRALGFSKGTIAAQFCTVSLVVSLGAVLLGAFLGWFVSKTIGGYFQHFFDLYYFNNKFYGGRILLAVVVTIMVGQVATLLSMGYVNHISPAEAMTRPTPKEAFKSEAFKSEAFKPFHIVGFMKKGNSFFKYSLFSLLRNKVRFFFSIICLSASAMMVFSAFAFGASKDKILVSYYEDRINYDCEAFFAYEPPADKIGNMKELGILGVPESVRYYKKIISFGGISEEAVFQAIPKDTDKVRILDSDEKEIRLKDDGIILESHLAEKLGLKVGDAVTIEGESFLLTGISLQHEGRVQYISTEAAERLGKPMIYSVIMNVEKKQQVALSQRLSGIEGYVFASFVDRNYQYWKNGFAAFTACVVAIILFSILIGYVIITNTLRANLLEQKRELCILRTLGFQCSELSFRLFFQTAIYYICACLIGIPMGAFVAKTAFIQMETEGRSYPFVNEPYLYLQTIILVLGYLTIGHIMSMRTLKKWDIVESVKDKE